MPVHHNERFIRIHTTDNHIMSAALPSLLLKNIGIRDQCATYARCPTSLYILLCDDLRRGWDFLYIVFRTRRGNDDFIKGVDGQLFGLCRYPPMTKTVMAASSAFLCAVLVLFIGFPHFLTIKNRPPRTFSVSLPQRTLDIGSVSYFLENSKNY